MGEVLKTLQSPAERTLAIVARGLARKDPNYLVFLFVKLVRVSVQTDADRTDHYMMATSLEVQSYMYRQELKNLDGYTKNHASKIFAHADYVWRNQEYQQKGIEFDWEWACAND